MPTKDPPGPIGKDGRPLAPLSHAVFLLARAQRAYAAALLRRHGLHPGQELLLLQLFEQDGQTQGALLDAVGLDHSTVSRSLTRMEAAGLVRRRVSDTDRRAMVVSLTPAGRRLRSPLQEVWAELERTTSSGVAADAHDDLVRALHEVRQAVVARAREAGVPDLQRGGGQAAARRKG